MQEQAGIFAHGAGNIQQRHDRRRLLDAPKPVDVDDVAAGPERAAQRAAHVELEPTRIGLVAARVASAISAAVICAKSFFCSTSLSETERRRSCSCTCGSSRIEGCDNASW